MQVPEIVDRLRTFPTFVDVPVEQLEWLARESEVRFYDDYVLRPGDATEYMMVVLDGGFRVYSIQNQQQKEIMVQMAGAVTGMLPFSRMTTSPIYAEVVGAMTTLELHRSKFHDMMRANYELMGVVVHQMIDRVRTFTSAHFQNEKLMSLGKLSAGLAHELNNPASAIVRSAEDLHSSSVSPSESLRRIHRLDLSDQEVEGLAPILDRIADRPPLRTSLIERGRREEALIDWLADHNLSDDHAEVLADASVEVSDLDEIASCVAAQSLPALFVWLQTELHRQKAVTEIAESSRRISTLIRSIKAYTRMDQVHDMQQVDINEGIRNTLMILQHKIRKNSVQLEAQLSETLPTIKGFPGELNQVWTNLMDNALDAMKEGGTLTVYTGLEKNSVIFRVTDTGAGISSENLQRIFDPFFTTKDVGEGTGVGLDVVQKVVTSHGAKIQVESRPGHTEFTVCFPNVHK